MLTQRKRKLFGMGMWIFLICVACQPASHHLSPAPVHPSPAKTQAFNPYVSTEVPQLKKLILQPGFQDFVAEQPYILGYSYDGVYLAVILFDHQAEAYRMEIHHTLKNEIITTLYLPLQQHLKEKSSLFYSQNEAEEHLEAIQETVDLGYRIKIPAQPVPFLLNQKTRLDPNISWWLHPVTTSHEYRLMIGNSVGNRWQLLQNTLPHPVKWQPIIYVTSFPRHPSMWTVIAVAQDKKGSVQLLIHSLDTQRLTKAWSEDELKRKAKGLLPQQGEIVYRSLHAPAQPPWYLVVSGLRQKKVNHDSLLFQAKVNRFVLMDEQGNPLIEGKRSGVYHENQPIDPGKKKGAQYQISLFAKEHERKPYLLIADHLDHQGRLLRTTEWIWDEKKQFFQLLSPQK